jgi:hypothetical protein
MKSVYRQSYFAFISFILFLIFSVPAAKVWAQAPTISGFNPTSGNPGQVLLFHRYVKNRSL